MTHDEAFTILKTGANAVLTGPAGSGKTYLLNRYVEYLKNNGVPVAVTASTGIAATHIGGQTIHSWSGIGIQESLNEYDLLGMEDRSQLTKRLESVAVLIIDEISMLHHFQLDMVDKVLRRFKKSEEAFGGVQVVLCGDFFQLPPVGKSFGNGTPRFAYHSDVWKKANFSVLYLETQYRQEDGDFLEVLSAIREARVNDATRETLTSRHNVEWSLEIEPTRLHTHNANVDEINNAELLKLSGAGVHFTMSTKGKKPLVEQLIKSCLAPFELVLKGKARVMFVKNNFEKGYVNGTLGIVEEVDQDGPVVRLIDGRKIVVEPVSWTIEEDGKVRAEIIQFPLRLAWAITVHKSQGMSLDAVEVDLSRAFEKGMGYVALSRVRTLSGLVLRGMNEMALEINEEAFRADKRLQVLSKEVKQKFESLDTAEKEKMAKDFIGKYGGKVVEKISTYDQTKKLIADKYTVSEIAKERGFTRETVIAHLEKISKEDPDCDISYFKKEITPTKFKKIMIALEELDKGTGEVLLSPVKNKVGSNISFDEIRLARIFYTRDKG